MTEESEILWHIEQIEKNRTILEQLKSSGIPPAVRFSPKPKTEIEHLKAQIAESELIVASSRRSVRLRPRLRKRNRHTSPRSALVRRSSKSEG